MGRENLRATMKLLAIDPGTVTGVAVFDGRILQRSYKMSHGKAVDWVFTWGEAGDQAIIELPRIYPGSRADPNDIANLRGKAESLGSILKTARNVKVEYVYPRDWKGSTPKDIHNRRVMRTLDELECLVVVKNHNVIDAVGLGLWKLGRLR